MAIADLKPNDRYAIIGKTGSGKTAFAMVLASTFAASLSQPWEVWWLDTKNDPQDITSLRKWGFRNAASKRDRDSEPKPGQYKLPNAIYWRIDSKDKRGKSIDTVEQVQHLLGEAYHRGHVIVVVDEYVQATPSTRYAGQNLLDVFQRGRSKNVGLIGLTQEPVYVPRQLISQASHIVLFSLSYANDIKYARNIYPEYQNPKKYAFYWGWIDGGQDFVYWPNQKVWFENLQVAWPKPVPVQA